MNASIILRIAGGLCGAVSFYLLGILIWILTAEEFRAGDWNSPLFLWVAAAGGLLGFIFPRLLIRLFTLFIPS